MADDIAYHCVVYIMINYVKDFFVLYAVPGTYSIPSPSPATDSPEPVILSAGEKYLCVVTGRKI